MGSRWKAWLRKARHGRVLPFGTSHPGATRVSPSLPTRSVRRGAWGDLGDLTKRWLCHGVTLGKSLGFPAGPCWARPGGAGGRCPLPARTALAAAGARCRGGEDAAGAGVDLFIFFSPVAPS